MFFLLFLLFALPAFATVYYVRPGGIGSGLSWGDASSDLSAILDKAQAGDEIWVAAGTYYPSSLNRFASFHVKDGVRLFGGFSGRETERIQRDWGKNPTLLSGEIGAPGEEDNSYHVVYTKNAGPGTMVNGFIITGGNADGKVSKGARTRGGGGWFDEGTDGGISQPEIVNCTFLGNNGLEGGAFFGSGQNGSSSPTFTSCTFLGNRAKLDGGAVYSDGRDESTNEIKFINCVFQDNMSTYGAAIFVENGKDDTALLVERCIFKKNNAFLWGGGIYYNFPNGGYFDIRIQECIFEDNYPTDVNKNRFLNNPDQDLAKR